MENFLIKYGLYAVFGGSIVEGDAMPIVAGVVAHLGYFNLLAAWAACVGGMFGGDCAWYWAGRRFSAPISKSRFYQNAAAKAERFVGNSPVWRQLAVARLVYGTRTFTLLYCGIRKVNFFRFAAADFAVCVVWAALLMSIGYFASQSVEALIGDVKEIEFGVLILIVCAAGLIALWRFLAKKRFAKDEKK